MLRDINAPAMPRSRIEIYWKKIESAPEGVTAQVRVTDGCGSDYLLPYPCKLHEGRVGPCGLRQALGSARDVLEAVCRDHSEEQGRGADHTIGRSPAGARLITYSHERARPRPAGPPARAK
jgi:hypothetical protein